MQLKIGYLFQCPPRAAPWVYIAISKAPCKGKSFVIAGALKAFALTGRQACVHHYPGRCPGLGASALSGRAAQNLLLPLQGVWRIPAKD